MSKSVKINYIFSIFYQLLSFIVPIASIPYLSRIFGPEGMGIYSYTSSIAQYFYLFAMLGLNNYGVRAVAVARDNKRRLEQSFSEIFFMQVLVSVIVLFFYVFFSYIFVSDYRFFFFLLIPYVSSTLFDVNWFFFGMEKFQITVIRNSLIKLLSLALIFLLIKQKEDLWIYFLIHAVSTFVSTLVLWPSIFKNIKIQMPQFADITKHIKPNLIMFIPVVAISVYKYMDKIMLGGFSIKEAGYYENVEKVLTVVLGLITAFGTVMLPRISNLVANSDFKKVEEYLKKSMDFVMFLCIGMTFGMYAIAPTFVSIFFGEDFSPCILIMEILGISAIFSSWANVIRTQYLIPYHKDNIYVISVIAGAVLNFFGNLIMIPQYAAMGAVYSTLLAEFVVAVIQTSAARKELPCVRMICSVLPYSVIGVIMVYVLSFFNAIYNDYFQLIIKVSVGLVFYCVCVFLYKKIRNGFLAVKI